MTCAQLADVTSRDRHRDSVPVGEADHRGADGVEFHGSAGLGVALHRRTHAGRKAVEEGQDLLVVTGGSFGSGDGGHLGHESAQVVAVALPHVAGRGLLVGGEEGERGEEVQLAPEDLLLVVAEPDGEARLLQVVGQLLDLRAELVDDGQFDDDERAGVQHHSRLGPGGLDADGGRDDPGRGITLPQQVDVLDAVEQRHEQRVAQDVGGTRCSAASSWVALTDTKQTSTGSLSCSAACTGVVKVPNRWLSTRTPVVRRVLTVSAPARHVTAAPARASNAAIRAPTPPGPSTATRRPLSGVPSPADSPSTAADPSTASPRRGRGPYRWAASRCRRRTDVRVVL